MHLADEVDIKIIEERDGIATHYPFKVKSYIVTPDFELLYFFIVKTFLKILFFLFIKTQLRNCSSQRDVCWSNNRSLQIVFQAETV